MPFWGKQILPLFQKDRGDDTDGIPSAVIVAIFVAAVAIFFFINVTDDEPPFRQTQIFNKQKYEKRAEGAAKSFRYAKGRTFCP